jgi:purine-binding chemotaxis protein CheW
MSAEEALLLPVGADLYALPLGRAREVVAGPAVTPLVTAPPAVLGLFNLRGQIVPLLDTAALLGTGVIETPAFAVVVDDPRGLAGLSTTGVPSRGTLDNPTGPSELAGTTRHYRVGGRVATLLDPAELLGGLGVAGHEGREGREGREAVGAGGS